MRGPYLAGRLQAALAWWGRGAVAVALSLATLEWVGWASGQHLLTNTFGYWFPMRPWAAVLVAVLGVAILTQIGCPSRSRERVGFGLALVAGVVAVVFMIEYATGRSFGLDQMWFPEAVRTEQPFPGRPLVLTGVSLLLLSAGVSLIWVDRRWGRVMWGVGLAGAYFLSALVLAKFLLAFGKNADRAVPPDSSAGISAALCVALLVFAALVARPDRNPVALLLDRPDRAALFLLFGVFAIAPVLTALVHQLLHLRGVSADDAWVTSIVMGNTACFVLAILVFNRERKQQREVEEEFGSIIENAPNSIAVLNLRGGFEFGNQAFVGLLGLTDKHQIVGRTPDDLLPWGAELTRTFRDAWVAASKGELVTVEFVPDDQRTVEVKFFPVQDGRGRPFGVAGIGTDVTERVRVERRLRERIEFEEFLSRAIIDGRLVVYAQPIADARNGQVVEEELLVRMIGPDGQVMVPGEFLPQAQRFGMMPTIDRFMVARGIELARAGRRVAVNLSAESINDAATTAAIADELRQAGDAADRVSFEITESTALASREVAERFSNGMRSLGCRLALDDFGTGFGSFTELRGLTLHKLKIDRSFVSDMLSNKQDESVVKMIVGIAREFGLLTTAEGVEDDATRTRLVELGVKSTSGLPDRQTGTSYGQPRNEHLIRPLPRNGRAVAPPAHRRFAMLPAEANTAPRGPRRPIGLTSRTHSSGSPQGATR